MIKLQVLISTHKSLQKVSTMSLPQVENVAYLISCQSASQALPKSLRRSDIEVHFSDEIGISRNRNNTLRLATAPYVLFADDDLTFYPEGLEHVIDAFDANPDLDIATFRFDSSMGKIYPPIPQNLWKPFKGYYVTAFEIAVRRENALRRNLWFNPLISFGAPYLMSGEENLFLEVAKRKGMRGMFFPITICRHDHESTGVRCQSEPGVLRSQGALILLSYPYTAIPRLVLKAHRTRGRFFKNLWYLLQGSVYALKHRELLQ